MKIVGVVAGYTLLLLTMAFGGALLSYWNVERTAWLTERMNLAHRSYSTHLRLSAHSYQLFKQFGDAIVIGDQDGGFGEREMIGRVFDDINEIRAIIAAEIRLAGEQEREELAVTDEIAKKINVLIFEFEDLIRTGRSLDPVTRWLRFSDLLDEKIDQEFRSLMEDAIREEGEEADAARRELEDGAQRIRLIAMVFALVASVLTLAVTFYYRAWVAVPLRRLMQGVEHMRAGEFNRPIVVTGRDEVGHISHLINQLAADVSKHRQALERQNAMLESAVAERTEELERLLEEAHRAEVNRRRLLAEVSHELKTPLTIIHGESDVALRGHDTSEADYREALCRTREAAAHTSALIDDLLFIARQEGGERNLQLERVDLVAFLKDALSLSSRRVSLDTALPQAIIHGDRLRLRQSVLALLHNAFMHGGEHVAASLQARQGGYRISVEDDGSGLADSDKELVFERFFRGANAAYQHTEGSGLGLPIVRAIARAHGGEAGLHDRHGGGLVVYIDLPRSISDEANA